MAAVACLSVLARAQAVSLARSLSLAAYTQSQGARQAPSRCAPAAGPRRGFFGSGAWLRLVRVERSPPERCCVMELLCALSAQRDDEPERSADAQAGRGAGQVSVRGPWSWTGAVGGADRGMGYGLRRDLTRVCGARAALETETGKTKNCRDHGVRIVEGVS